MHPQNPLLRNATGKGFPKYNIKREQKNIIPDIFLFCCKINIYSETEQSRS